RRQVCRLWLSPDRARCPFHGMVELLRIEAHQGHEMEQFGMFGTCFQRLMTAKLGVEISTGPHVPKDGLTESGLHGQRETHRIGFGSLAAARRSRRFICAFQIPISAMLLDLDDSYYPNNLRSNRAPRLLWPRLRPNAIHAAPARCAMLVSVLAR